jgi:hypothetical protein
MSSLLRVSTSLTGKLLLCSTNCFFLRKVGKCTMAPSVRLIFSVYDFSAHFCPDRLENYLRDGLDHAVPEHANPSDHALDAVSTDFMRQPGQGTAHILELAANWRSYAACYPNIHNVSGTPKSILAAGHVVPTRSGLQQTLRVGLSRTRYLMERNWINYSRNLLAYGVRLGMYCEFPSTAS